MMESVSHVILWGALAAAVVTDVREHKVYNWLTVPAAAMGLILGAAGGGHSFLNALAGFGAGLGLGLVFMVFFRSGAGDAKLLIVIGALSGARFVMGSALYGAIAALPIALFLMWRRHVFGYTLSNLARNAVQRAAGASDVALDAGSRAGKLAYALPIAIGAMLTWLLHGWAGIGPGGG
jgi:Flp pilus assembly protein protease CpaA